MTTSSSPVKRKGADAVAASSGSSPVGQLAGREVSFMAPEPPVVKCGKREASDSAYSGREVGQNAVLRKIPGEIWSRVFSFLSRSERVGKVPLVCRTFHQNKRSTAIEYVSSTDKYVTLEELLDCGLDFQPQKPIRLKLCPLTSTNPAYRGYMDESGLYRRELIEHIIKKWGPFIQKCDGSMGGADTVLSVILESCPNLQDLSLNVCRDITGACFEGKHLPHLQTLDARQTNLTDEDLGYLITACPNLQSLHIDDPGERITGACFKNKRLPFLQILNAGEADFTEEGLGHLITACPHLQRIAVSRYEPASEANEITGACFEGKHLPYLHTFRAGTTALTNEGFGHLVTACPRLQSLDISWIGQLTGACFEGKHLPYLQELDILGTRFTDDDFDHLVTACPHLQSLDISENDEITGISFADKHLPQLQELNAEAASLTDEGLDHLVTACPHLQSLDISRNKEITGACFEGKDLPHLQTLDARQTNLTDEGLDHLITACPHLQSLDISRNGITGISFAGKRLPELQTLHVRETALTGEGLVHILIACPGLRHLILNQQEETIHRLKLLSALNP